MTPVSREEMYLYKLAGGSITLPSPVSRKEMYLAKACGEAVTVPTPVSREEMYLYKLSGGTITLPSPVSRLELLMAAACGEAVTPYTPVSRLEWFWSRISSLATISGVPPLTFTADGTPITAYIIAGNMTQPGTPAPDAPVAVQGCGDWDADANSYKIPITCGSQTTPIYLGQTQTVRRIKKLVLTGDEDWKIRGTTFYLTSISPDYARVPATATYICTHFAAYQKTNSAENIPNNSVAFGYSSSNQRLYCAYTGVDTVDGFKQWLADQYTAGTPVTIWYVLANEQTGIVNEPLCKIGNYADTVSNTNTGAPSIPTVTGHNTLTVDTALQPSEVSITGRIS